MRSNSLLLIVDFFITFKLIFQVSLGTSCFSGSQRQYPHHPRYRVIPPLNIYDDVLANPYQFLHEIENLNCMLPDGFKPECGTQVLQDLDRIFIRQRDTRTSWNKNSYVILDSLGREILHAEEVGYLWRTLFEDHTRPFDIMVKNRRGKDVIQLIRDRTYFRWTTRSVQVYSPPGNFIGSIEEDRTHWFPFFNVKNDKDQTILLIRGVKPECPNFNCPVYSNLNFNFNFTEYVVFSNSPFRRTQVEVGRISNQWAGYYQEYFTEADNFVINFPADLDVNIKTLLIGGCIFIDYMYFESTTKYRMKEEDPQ